MAMTTLYIHKLVTSRHLNFSTLPRMAQKSTTCFNPPSGVQSRYERSTNITQKNTHHQKMVVLVDCRGYPSGGFIYPIH